MKTIAAVVIASLAIGLFVGSSRGTPAKRVEPTVPPFPVRVVIAPCPLPKSLVEWWEHEQAVADNAPFVFAYPRRPQPFQPLAFYAGSESPENLIAERDGRNGSLRWGPQAMDTPYRVAWRGMGHVALEVPANATEGQVAGWKAEIERCDPAIRSFEIRHGE